LAVSEARLRSKFKKKTWRTQRTEKTSFLFFWISGDTFLKKKQNCSLVMRKTLYTPRHPPLQALLSTDETRPSPLSGKSIAAYTLSDFVFEAFPRLRRAKGPNKERQALSSDRERVEQPLSLFTHD